MQKVIEKTVPYALIFDVDGVLTHPSEKKMTETEVFNQLQKRLEKNYPIILNTGRATDFMIKKILIPLENKIQDKTLLQNILAVGEKGAVMVTYDEQGNRQEIIDKNISVPENLKEETRKLILEKYSDVVFYDETKKTMISLEMLDGLDVEIFKPKQAELDEELQEMLSRHNVANKYKVDPTRIATDVENKHVGKALGVEQALKWLEEKKIKAEKYITFGDSSSDVPMAERLYEKNLPVTFVFVGEPDILAGKNFDFPVVYTDGHCETGTLEYLKSLE